MKKNAKIIALEEPKSSVSELFRVLRTSIQFKSMDKQLKKLIVTSGISAEGKTTVIVNLAVVLAQSDMKVLLIDADLRKANVHNYFGFDATHGLTLCLAKKGEPKDYIQKTSIAGLDVITSGPVPPNPSEMLGSEAMKKFVEKVESDYDMVLFDSPPVGIVTDAAVLSRQCDGVILVCGSGQAKIDPTKFAKEQLDKVGANILGVVLNKIQRNEQEEYHYYNG